MKGLSAYGAEGEDRARATDVDRAVNDSRKMARAILFIFIRTPIG